MATTHRPTPFRRRQVGSRAPFGPILPFLLPLPLLLVLFKALANGSADGSAIAFIGSAASLTLYFVAGYFLRRAKFYEREANKRSWLRPTRVPWRYSAAVLTGAATGIASLLLTGNPSLFAIKPVITAASFAITAALGSLFLYGRDPHYEDHSAGLVGVTADELIDALDEAEKKIAAIELAASKVGQTDIRQQLNRIASSTRGVLDTIEQDPKDLRRARKFLKVYLDGARKVAENYADAEHIQNNSTIETNLKQVLDTIEETIEQQQEKLLRNDILELDVQIEVLQTQLKHEGIS